MTCTCGHADVVHEDDAGCLVCNCAARRAVCKHRSCEEPAANEFLALCSWHVEASQRRVDRVVTMVFIAVVLLFLYAILSDPQAVFEGPSEDERWQTEFPGS